MRSDGRWKNSDKIQENDELALTEERAVLDQYQQSLRCDHEQNLAKEEDLIREKRHWNICEKTWIAGAIVSNGIAKNMSNSSRSNKKNLQLRQQR